MDAAKHSLAIFNSIMKEHDGLYRDAARALGLSDCAFWLLYTLRDADAEMTQRDVCAVMFQPKQTVNSALKSMERDGLIELRCGLDKRSKNIYLTEKGLDLAARTVDLVMVEEAAAFQGMTGRQRDEFLTLLTGYTALLRERMSDFLNERGAGGAI